MNLPAIRCAAVLLVVGLVLVTGCAGDDEPVAVSPAAPVESSSPVDTAAPSAASSTPPDFSFTSEFLAEGTPDKFTEGLATEVIELVGGKSTERLSDLSVAKGDQVRLVFVSDEAHEIHIHGYDLYLNVKPNQRNAIRFLADKAGSWVVEVHETGFELFSLDVR